jgi:hypothetical protein
MSVIATAPDTLRNADLPTLAAALNDQRTRAVDLVVPARSILFRRNALIVDGVEPMLSENGVTEVNGLYLPTRVALEGISAKLKFPLEFAGRCRTMLHMDVADGRTLFDVNVNRLLQAQPLDARYLVRLLKSADGAPGGDGADGVMRALLSDRFRCIDNFDVVLAALRGMTEAGITDPIIEADLTERRMIVKVGVPQIATLAPKLLEGYRSPFGGHDASVVRRDGREGGLGGWTPERVANASRGEGQTIEGGGETVFAGFVISNSEVGGGGFNITPRLVIRLCNNGLTIAAEALKRVHLGAQMDAGVVDWSEETARRNLALVASQTADAVRKFISPDYLNAKVAELEADAATPLTDAQTVIATVSKSLGFSEVEATNILAHFIQGGQMTAGGVMQAVTSAAQLHEDGDDAWAMEAKGIPAMHAAVAAMRTLAKV